MKYFAAILIIALYGNVHSQTIIPNKSGLYVAGSIVHVKPDDSSATSLTGAGTRLGYKLTNSFVVEGAFDYLGERKTQTGRDRFINTSLGLSYSIQLSNSISASLGGGYSVVKAANRSSDGTDSAVFGLLGTDFAIDKSTVIFVDYRRLGGDLRSDLFSFGLKFRLQ